MSKKKIIIFITLLLLFLSSPYIIGSIYNTGITNEESIQEDDFYQENEDLDENKSSISENIIGLFINKTFANENNISYYPKGKEVKTIEKKEKVYFSIEGYKLLEKYYILGKLNIKNIPTDLFYYGKHDWKNFRNILNTYDYLNKTKKVKEYNNIKKEFREKIFYKKDLKKDIYRIIKNYSDNKKTLNKYNVSYFPKEFIEDEGFQFMIDGVYNHPYLIKETERIGKLYGFDGDLVKAAILTEQFRYAGTYRGYVKNYLKRTPFIFTMTKWSYGVGGIKEGTGDKIKEDSKIYKTHGIFDKQSYDLYKGFSKQKFLTDKYWETVYPSMLISNIINRWDKAGFSIRKKPGIILTLYNFGNPSNKKPHANSKVGGSNIKFFEDKAKSYTYSFGGLGESLYYFIKMYEYKNRK